MTLGDKIRLHRKQLKMTQTELGERLGVKTNAVSKWEVGRVEDIPTSKIKALATLFGVPISYLIDDSAEGVIGYSALPESSKLPIIGRIACGAPITAQENIEGYTSVPDSWRADFCLVCRGDSMSPKILDGDVVAIRSQQTADNGQVAAVLIDGEATLKRVYLRPERGILELHPINPDFETLIYVGDEIAQVRIDGIAVGLCRAI